GGLLSRRPLASRVTWGMAAVAALSALVLACAAAITACFLWEAQARHDLADATETLSGAIKREAHEERLTLEAAAAEAFRERAVAFWVGGAVARRTTRPLLDLQARIRGLRPLEPLPPAADADASAEVADLEDAFRALWGRLEDTVRREREFAANASHELRMPLA